jgi:hypothetical protein
MKKIVRLSTFIKGDHQNAVPGCANYYNGECVYDCACKIEKGKRCAYFERSVLPVAAQLGIGGIIGDAYSDKVGLIGLRPKMTKDARRCPCGEILQPRQRFCKKCAERRRKDTYRKQNKITRKLDPLYGQKMAARKVVRLAVAKGRLANPKLSVCALCKNQMAVMYHHYKGYDLEHQLDVIPVCRKCDKKDHCDHS